MFITLPNFAAAAANGFDIVAKNQKETVYRIPAVSTARELLALRLTVGRVGGRVWNN